MDAAPIDVAMPDAMPEPLEDPIIVADVACDADDECEFRTLLKGTCASTWPKSSWSPRSWFKGLSFPWPSAGSADWDHLIE